METFKFLLFGLTGASMIFWICVIAFWHTYSFPKLFKEDNSTIKISRLDIPAKNPNINRVSLPDRGKYSLQSFVIADFNDIEDGYRINRLYSFILISLGFMSFLIITFGLHSGFNLYGLS